ncbi:MAG: LuxR C-terminal-related transcriptional regulator [Caulobacter sp.]|nr:LuxR C-terminal-related transcriptional regulator [Caulobacter sp.]
MADRSSDLVERIIRADAPKDRWEALESGLRDLGLDQINYAYIDQAAHTLVEARTPPFMTTMRPDWVERYVEKKYDLVDDLVDHVKTGVFTPQLFVFEQSQNFIAPGYAREAREAGLSAGLVIPLCGDPRSLTVTAGIMFGSSLAGGEAECVLSEKAAALTALGHIFHTGMIGEFKRRQAGARPLSPRERDCLQFAARGLRAAAIADRLGLAQGTVELYCANARRKLGAKSLTEAVARAILFQQIELE